MPSCDPTSPPAVSSMAIGALRLDCFIYHEDAYLHRANPRWGGASLHPTGLSYSFLKTAVVPAKTPRWSPLKPLHQSTCHRRRSPTLPTPSTPQHLPTHITPGNLPIPTTPPPPPFHLTPLRVHRLLLSIPFPSAFTAVILQHTKLQPILLPALLRSSPSLPSDSPNRATTTALTPPYPSGVAR
jgi:hypothetical protein